MFGKMIALALALALALASSASAAPKDQCVVGLKMSGEVPPSWVLSAPGKLNFTTCAEARSIAQTLGERGSSNGPVRAAVFRVK